MDPLFGSETRGRVLEHLAQSVRPQSAYRVAKAVGAEPIQVLRILKMLRGLAEASADGWVLVNEDLRRFLRARSAQRESEIRQEKDELLVRFGLRPSLEHERRRV